MPQGDNEGNQRSWSGREKERRESGKPKLKPKPHGPSAQPKHQNIHHHGRVRSSQSAQVVTIIYHSNAVDVKLFERGLAAETEDQAMSANRIERETETPAAIAATSVRCTELGRGIPVELALIEVIGAVPVLEAGVGVALEAGDCDVLETCLDVALHEGRRSERLGFRFRDVIGKARTWSLWASRHRLRQLR